MLIFRAMFLYRYVCDVTRGDNLSCQSGLFSASPLASFQLSSALKVDQTHCCFAWERRTWRVRECLGCPRESAGEVGL